MRALLMTVVLLFSLPAYAGDRDQVGGLTATRTRDLAAQRAWQDRNRAAVEDAYNNPRPHPSFREMMRDLFNALSNYGKTYPGSKTWYDQTSWRGSACAGACGGGLDPSGGDGSWGKSMDGRGAR